MFARTPPEDPARVLVIVATKQFSGHAVVDGWGLAPGSFATWDLISFATNEARTRSFKRHLIRSLCRYRPAVLVLGVPRFDGPSARVLREEATQLATALGMSVVERPVAAGRRLLLGCLRGSNDDALADHITSGFFPELASFRNGKQTVQRRYRSHSFEAVALALHELVERAPLSAAVIARNEAFSMGRFNAALTESARRHFPDNL
ncbi:MAG: hypothetical protein WBP56_20645 [Polyangia bacterium]